METLDQVRLNFSPESLWLLNVVLGFIMFGVALELRVEDFIRVIRAPISPLVGVVSQFLLLPAVTLLLVWIIQPPASLALGMFLVAACPGGNISNYISHMAKGNTALSVSLTAIATTLAVVMTPLTLHYWSSLYPPAAALLQEVDLNVWNLFLTVSLLLGLPLALGMWFADRYPDRTRKIVKPIKRASIIIFVGFVVIAIIANGAHFERWALTIFALVILHNGIAFATGYLWARLTGRNVKDTRSITIETGIQNSGLGLVLIFTFFGGMGGMALIAAGWGIWHMIGGLALAKWWSGRPTN